MTSYGPDDIEIVFRELAPQDIERSSGVSGELQRLWRSRGLLEKRVGTRTRYTAIDAAAFCLAMTLIAGGSTHNEAMSVARAYQRRVMQLAIHNVDGVVATKGTPDFVRWAHDELERDNNAEFACRLAGAEENLPIHVLVSVNGQPFEPGSEAPDFDTIPGARITKVVTLVGIAYDFANRLGMPLITVQEKGIDPGSTRIVRRVLEATSSQMEF